MSRREAEKRFRQQLIGDAATKLFKERGFEATQMDEIAREAEFSKTTVYKYFKSKDELALLVYQRIHSEKMEFLKQAMEKHEGAVDRLEAIGRAYYTFFESHTDYLRFQLNWDYRGLDRRNIRPEIVEETSDFIARDVDFFSGVLRQGIDEGTLRADLEIEKTLDLFYLTLRCVMNQILLINPETRLGSFLVPDESAYTEFLNLLVKSLQPSPVSGPIRSGSH